MRIHFFIIHSFAFFSSSHDKLVSPNQREANDTNRCVQQQQRPVAARALLINNACANIRFAMR
jgi:hypothetical protein